MNKQLETRASGAADLQVDLDEDVQGIVDQGVHSTAVAASIARTASLAIKTITEKLKERGVDLTPCTQGKRVVVRHNGYCYYYDKQPRKTAQWKNEQRRFRK